MSNQESKVVDMHAYQARRDAEARRDSTPNSVYVRRRILAVAGAGVLAIAAFIGGKAGVDALKEVHNEDALNGELSQPLPDVAAEIRSGEIDASQVGRFKIGETEYAWTAASDLTRQDHESDTGTVASIIEAQVGNPVEAGSTVIVPKSETDAHPQQ